MSIQNAPIFLAFQRGEQRQAIRKQNETPEQRSQREEFNKKCAESRMRDQARAKLRQLEDEQRRSKGLANKALKCKRQKARWGKYKFPTSSENGTPQVQGVQKVNEVQKN